MQVIIKTNKKRPGYTLVYSTAIQRGGRVLADLSQNVEFLEEEKDVRVQFR